MKKKIVSLLLAGTLALAAMSAVAPAGAAETVVTGETSKTAEDTGENSFGIEESAKAAGDTDFAGAAEESGNTENQQEESGDAENQQEESGDAENQREESGDAENQREESGDTEDQHDMERGICDIIADQDGSFLAVDSCNKVIWRLREGEAQRYAGIETQEDLYGIPVGGYVDGSLEESAFGLPWAIAPFLDGFAVSDASNNAVRLVRKTGVETVNGRTKEPLAVTELGVAFDYPTGLAADDAGNLYVSDTHKGAVRRISKDGLVTTVTDELADPMGLYWSKGTLYIAETGANRILELDLQSGEKKVLAGSGEPGSADGPASAASFAGPIRITGDAGGMLYVSDSGNGCVRRIAAGQVTTVKTAERLFSPAGILVQGQTLVICDSFLHQIYQVELGEAS